MSYCERSAPVEGINAVMERFLLCKVHGRWVLIWNMCPMDIVPS